MTIRLKDAIKCPGCGRENDAATSIHNMHDTPQDGDVSVCFKCCAVCEYTDNSTKLRLLSAEEFVDLPDEMRNLIQRATRAIKARSAKRAAARKSRKR